MEGIIGATSKHLALTTIGKSLGGTSVIGKEMKTSQTLRTCGGMTSQRSNRLRRLRFVTANTYGMVKLSLTGQRQVHLRRRP